MINRNKGGIRSVSVKARLAVAAAVLVGGGAASVVAVAANHGGSAATTTAESAGYTRSFHHTISEQLALTEALGQGMSWQASTTTLADMAPVRTFSQLEYRHQTLAVQRGIVLVATRKFLVVRSANGAIHLWWLSGATRVKDVVSSASGMAAMTGSYTATNTAMFSGNLIPTENVVAGSTSVVSQLTTPVAKPTTITINTGGEIITITVASSTATVTQPTTTTQPVTTTQPTTTTQTTWTRQSAWWTTDGVQRGDLVLVAGTRTNGKLKAELVLFAAPLTSMPTPSVSPTSTTFPTQTATPSAIPTPVTTITGQPASIGKSS
ncbi:MAG: hypothetical protein ABSA02_37920 [Trebonia sp.]|jgi:hypothetical protein